MSQISPEVMTVYLSSYLYVYMFNNIHCIYIYIVCIYIYSIYIVYIYSIYI